MESTESSFLFCSTFRIVRASLVEAGDRLDALAGADAIGHAHLLREFDHSGRKLLLLILGHLVELQLEHSGLPEILAGQFGADRFNEQCLVRHLLGVGVLGGQLDCLAASDHEERGRFGLDAIPAVEPQVTDGRGQLLGDCLPLVLEAFELRFEDCELLKQFERVALCDNGRVRGARG